MEDADIMVVEGITEEGIIVGGVIDGSSAGRWSCRIVCGRQNC